MSGHAADHPSPEEVRQALDDLSRWLLEDFATLPNSPMGQPASRAHLEALLRESPPERGSPLAEVIRQSRILRGHQLSHVDISDPNNFLLLVDGQIEIRVGGNHFMERLKILDQTLKTVMLDSSKIRYIDLRFDDVVIGPR